MDFLKAFGRVKHNFWIEELTQSPLYPYIVNSLKQKTHTHTNKQKNRLKQKQNIVKAFHILIIVAVYSSFLAEVSNEQNKQSRSQGLNSRLGEDPGNEVAIRKATWERGCKIN